jgi:1-acyl-sn-glycerol-3-phosphate acyltransferase
MSNIWIPFGFIVALSRFILLILFMAIVVLLGIILIRLKLADQNLAFKIRTYWCKLAIILLGIRLHVTGSLEQSRTVLYVANHRSLVDPLVLFSFLKTGYVVSKAEVASYPIIHSGATLSGVIYVERANKESRMRTKDSILQFLKEDKSIILFPEGTTGTNNHSLPFKKGSFEAAALANTSVVPIAMEMGNPKRDFWYSGGLFQQFIRTYSKWRTDVYIHFFDPIDSNSGEQLCRQSQDLINGKISDFQKKWIH